ncbi:MAG: cytochrome c family protein [Bacteroidota bacterium]|nr:cytochrome c family protein [Bacteroidota bacterium]
MKNAVTFIAVAVAFTALTAFTFQGSNEYIGSKSCKACHSNAKMGGTAYKTWEKSAHAKAFETLKSAEADKIAKEAGHTTKAAETDACLSCHVTGMNVKGAKFDKKFDKTEGVGCESCHGAGSAYKSKHAKDVAGAAKLGLTTPKGKDAEALCVTCHNEKSPTYKGFDFATMLKKIDHSK